MLVTSAIVTGLALGSMYGLIALGFHITYVVSKTVNFAQGSAMMLGAVLGYTFARPLRLALPARRADARSRSVRAFGLLVERTLVRPFAERGSNAWLMATVAGGIVLDNVVLFTFGKEPRSFPSFLAQKPVDLFGTGVYPLQLVIPAVGLGAAIVLHLAFRRTRYGKALLAVVQNRDAARLMGINVRRAIAVVLRALDRARRPCRPSDRPAVQRAFRHGHAVRHQGVRGRDPRRHHVRVGHRAGRPRLRPDRGAGDRLPRLHLHPDRRVHRGDRRARRACRTACSAAPP